MNFEQPVIHIMTTDPITIESDQKLSDARMIFLENDLHHLPVVEDERLVGIISSHDIVKLCLMYDSDDLSRNEFLDRRYTIGGVMQKGPTTVGVDATIRKAANLLAVGAFHALPVVGYNNYLKGIVTSTDMIKLLITKL